MSWLRVDDGFTSNSKVVQLSDKEFRVWMRVLCHCGRSQDPTVDRSTMNEVVGLTKTLVGRFSALLLLDAVGDVWEVHDWQQYQPKDATGADRQARWRARQRLKGDTLDTRSGKWAKTRAAVFERDAGVCVDCGKQSNDWNADHNPHRDDLREQGIDVHDIAYIQTRCHSCHARRTRLEAQERDRNSAQSVTEEVTEPLPRARAHARPSPVLSPEGSTTRPGSNGDGGTATAAEMLLLAIRPSFKDAGTRTLVLKYADELGELALREVLSDLRDGQRDGSIRNDGKWVNGALNKRARKAAA